MPRRVLGVLAAAGVVLVSWGAVSQPGTHVAPPAPVGPAQFLRATIWPGIVPAPEGSTGSYLLQHGRASALFRDTGLELRLPSRTQPARALGWSVAGGRAVRPQAEKPREATHLQRMGPGGSEGREVPTYGGLRYPGVRPGVDLWFEERAEGVEYGFRAERGADLKRVELEYAGAREVRVVEQGRALEVDLEEGVLREEGLWCAQEEADGTSRAVGCRFTDARRVGPARWAYAIEVDVEKPELPVVVDPLIRWNNYLGGTKEDAFGSMVVTDAGDIYVVGTMNIEMPDLLITIDGSEKPGTAVLLARFYEDGGFGGWRGLNGEDLDFGRAITLGKDGMVYVAGETLSGSFGSSFSYCLNHGAGLKGKKDAFVAQFDPVAFKFRGIYLLGREDTEELAHGIATGADGSLFLVGQTTALDFPGAPDASTDGGQEAFVVRLRPSALPDASTPDASASCPGDPELVTLEWSTVLRGARDDVAYAVTTDEGGRVYVTGKTASTNLHPSFTPSPAGPEGIDDVFVARLNPEDGGVDKGVYLGGQGRDEGRALALKGDGNANLFVAGTTRSADFPLKTGTGTTVSDAFVVTLDRDSLSVKGVRVVGGPSVNDEGLALAVEQSTAAAGMDIVYLGGKTASPGDFPRVQSFDDSFGGTSEGFVARVEVDAGAPVLWSSLVGGGGEDVVLALSSARPEHLFIGGTTDSDDLVPLGTPGYKRTPSGGTDLFLMHVGPDASTPGTGTDAGVDAGTDAGVDAGTDAGVDAGTDAGVDAGTPEPRSPLGWSCGAGGASGGPAALSLGTLAGLALLARRRKRADPPT